PRVPCSRELVLPTPRATLWKNRQGKSLDCSLHGSWEVANSPMPSLATWMRAKDEKWFQPFFDRHPDICVYDACESEVSMADMDGLLLTGGSDIAAEFLHQDVVDLSVLDKDVDVTRDRWEFAAVEKAMA